MKITITNVDQHNIDPFIYVDQHSLFQSIFFIDGYFLSVLFFLASLGQLSMCVSVSITRNYAYNDAHLLFPHKISSVTI